MAKKLGIPLQDIKELSVQVAEKLNSQDTRNEVGPEEIMFGMKIKEKTTSPTACEMASPEDKMHGTDGGIEQTTDNAKPVSHASPTQPGTFVRDPSPLCTKASETLPTAGEASTQGQSPEAIGVPKNTTPGSESNAKDPSELVSKSADHHVDATPILKSLPEPEASETTDMPAPSPVPKASQPLKTTGSVSDDEDSDVDIVVFKPKSRPGSSYIRKLPEVTKTSPPKAFTQAVTPAPTDHQQENQVELPARVTPVQDATSPSKPDSTKESVVQEPILEVPIPVLQSQKPRTPLSYTAALESGLPKKAPVKARPMAPVSNIQEVKPAPATTPTELPIPQPSRLTVNSSRSRPQTPRGGHTQGQNGFQHQPRQHQNRPQTPRDAGNQFPPQQDHHRSKKQSPQRMHQPKTIHSRSPSGEPSQQPPAALATEPIIPPVLTSSEPLQRHPSSHSSSSSVDSKKGNHRSPSDGASNAHNRHRNRPKHHPSYPRFDQVSAKAQRVAQHQPTATPIIIDADSFDRSSYVKPQFHAIQTHNVSTHNLNAHNANMRATNGQAQFAGMNGNGRFAGGRGGTGAGRAMPGAADGDVDFVLKSGTPRGRGRGTGRLWVP